MNQVALTTDEIDETIEKILDIVFRALGKLDMFECTSDELNQRGIMYEGIKSVLLDE